MLQFIVLGIIPGTHIQITFQWLVALTLAVAVILVVKAESPRLMKRLSRQIRKAHLSTN